MSRLCSFQFVSAFLTIGLRLCLDLLPGGPLRLLPFWYGLLAASSRWRSCLAVAVLVSVPRCDPDENRDEGFELGVLRFHSVLVEFDANSDGNVARLDPLRIDFGDGSLFSLPALMAASLAVSAASCETL